MAQPDSKERAFEVDAAPKSPIPCISNTPSDPENKASPPLIFTHGAGGTHTSPAMQHFAAGFSRVHPIIRFQGSTNLQSRKTNFTTILAHQDLAKQNVLGGRSMGARAAVMAATAGTTHLVLASYPLQANGQVRDEILVGISADVKVLFVSGDRDNMCDFALLQKVRQRMQAKTWLITVKGADHGMNVTPKRGTEPVGILVGDVVAKWILGIEEGRTEGEISWDKVTEKAKWSGWSLEKQVSTTGTPGKKAVSKNTTPWSLAKSPSKREGKVQEQSQEKTQENTKKTAQASPQAKKRKNDDASADADDSRKTRKSSRNKA